MLRQRLKHVFRGRPGRRFRDRYRRLSQRDPSPTRKLVHVGGGLVLIPIGLFFLPAPGPGFIVLLLAGVLLAGESLWVARRLDRMELAVRRWFRR